MVFLLFSIFILHLAEHKELVDAQQLTLDQLVTALGGKALPNGYYDQHQQHLHPTVKTRFEFW
jgi:hypothetical protein